MTEQRYDIVVQDKVARTIRTGLDEIGTSAKSAYDQLKMLNGEMGTRTASAAAAAQNAATKTAAATAKMNAEQAKAAVQAAKLDAAQTASALSAERLAQAQAKTALAQQRVATETAKTAEAQSKANIAAIREAEALERVAKAAADAAAEQKKLQGSATIYSSPIGPQAPVRGEDLFTAYNAQQAAREAAAARQRAGGAGGTESASVGATMQAGAAEAKAASAETVAAVEEMEAKTSTLFQRFKANAMGAFDSVRDFASGNGTRFRAQADELGAGAASAGTKLQGMGAKAGMTALSIRELLVVAREGSRGDFTRMAGSLSILAMSLDVLPAALTVAAVGFGTLYAARKEFNTQTEQDHLKDYAQSLGLTTKEMRKLQGATVDSKGELKELNVLQVEYIDVWNGLVTTVEDGFTRWKKASTDTASEWGKAFTVAGQIILAVYNGIDAAIIATGQLVRDELKASAEMYTHPIDSIKDGVKAVVNFKSNVVKDYKDIQQSESAFMASWNKNTQTAAQQRVKGLADAIISNRNPHKGPKGWDRAQNLANDNGALDAQLKNMDLYGDALERANQLEEIAKKYRDHNVPLTEAETAALMKKITAVQEGKRVQEAMTAADEAANGPARKYFDTVDALDKLMQSDPAHIAEYRAQLNMATRAYEDAIDPLAALNRELQKSGELMGLYGKDKDVASYIQSLQTAAEAKGQSIYLPGKSAANDNGDITVTARSKKLTPEAQGMVDEFKAQQQQGQYDQAFQAIDPKQKYQNPTDSSYILDNHKQLYDNIDKLRQQDVISEQEASDRKKNLDKAYLDARLSTTSQVLGQLATLQDSHSKTVAAIGKAAAVAQATIDGYRAVQSALAGPPGPPWSFAIAGATAAMTAVNVAKIAGIGFEQGGYTGDGGTKQVAGFVHGKEYVLDAPTTARVGIPALDALRNGASLSQAANGSGGTRMSIYPQAGVVMEEVSTSDDHIEMIARRTVKGEIPKLAPKAVADDINRSPNGHVSKAVQTQYGMKRAR